MTKEEQVRIRKIINQEPKIQINGVDLTLAQSMSVRCAVTSFRYALQDSKYREDLGSIADSYDARLSEVERIMIGV